MSATVMFHSIGLERHDWAYRHVAEPVDLVERKLAALARAGFESTFFGDPPTSERSVALTFDDGYLDNWVHLFPILEQFGLKATVFATPEFVDPRPLTRPRVPPGTVPAAGHRAEDCCAGFLSWPELIELERSGLVRVEPHGLTHTWYACGPRVVDFWHPGAATGERNLVWMLWNRFPQDKPFYLTRAPELERRIPYGTPVYEHGKALQVRRYFPSTKLDEILPDHVARQGGEAFFQRQGWRDELHELAGKHGGAEGEYESEDEQRQRVRDELARSKSILEERLGRQVECLCWPGGSASELGLVLARELGYTRFTVPSAWQASGNAPSGPGMISRISSLPAIEWRGLDLGQASAREFVWWIRAAGGRSAARWTKRLIVAKHLAQTGLGARRRSGGKGSP